MRRSHSDSLIKVQVTEKAATLDASVCGRTIPSMMSQQTKVGGKKDGGK